MRVMLLKDSPGGFDFSKFDTTDERPLADREVSDEQLASMFEGASLVFTTDTLRIFSMSTTMAWSYVVRH